MSETTDKNNIARSSLETPVTIDARFDRLFEQSPNGIVIIDAEGVVEQINPAAQKIFGYSNSEVVGKNISTIIPSVLIPAQASSQSEYLSVEIGAPTGHEREVLAIKKCGEEVPIELKVVEMQTNDRHHFAGIFRAVPLTRQQQKELHEANALLERRVQERTAELELANHILEKEIQERRRAQEITNSSLKEKEIFLKEIHHRVKNNLQLIISILNLHKDKAKDKQGVQTILEIQERIYAIALLHETLYQSGNFGRIQVDKYIRGLVSHLIQSTETGQKISIHYDIKELTLSLDESLPCGLIINELVLNSLKHAFLKSENPRIEICLRCSADQEITIVVKDNGTGYPADTLSQESDSIGLHLVQKLAEKLGGKVTFSNNAGAQTTITFLLEGNG